MGHLKPELHIEKYKKLRHSFDLLLAQPIDVRDSAAISTLAHWISYHIISVIIDQIAIPENLKHRNHRGVKTVLGKSTEVRAILGSNSDQLLALYNQIESTFMVKFQYGKEEISPDYAKLTQILDQLVDLCKNITKQIKGAP